jgi:exopolyphosphatase/guanosine-5'-triphosphate,3'-diphosphate pyrophosphatase
VTGPVAQPVDGDDLAAVEAQLGRPPRGARAVGHRCSCGLPDVVVTEPRLPDGTPFPTTYYLTCPRATSMIGTLEGSGLMREMEARLSDDPDLAAAYRSAHEGYLADRAALGEVPEIADVSAGGMPDRVKCLHAVAAHALAAGAGVNPLGDEVLRRLGAWWSEGPCVSEQIRAHPSPAEPVMAGRIAAIDCGTNSIKLLIGELPQVLVRESRMVRLGQAVDTTGVLGEDALDRTFAAIDEYAALIREHDVRRIRFCATSATRDARNARVFTDGVRERLGVTPDVLSGDEEAALVFDGAVSHLRAPVPEPVLVVDIGGGSTELVLGRAHPDAAVSIDIGSVRLHERHLHGDPPTSDQVAACLADIDRHLDDCPVPLGDARSVIGTSGTIKTLAAGMLDLPFYDRDMVDGARLGSAETRAYVERLVAMTVAERLAIPSMHPGRADVIAAGALIWSRVLSRTGVDRYTVSEADILYGIARSLVDR